jgi:hypothetical protein
MPLFDDTLDVNDALVRKSLATIVAVAPYTTADITGILDSTAGDLKALPVGYVPLGRLNEDGTSWARETELSEIFGHGSSGPARSDIRRAVRRVSLTLLEVRKAGLQLAQGVTSLGETVTKVPASTGNQHITWDEPETPTYPYMRLIAIAKDQTGEGEIYVAKHALKCKVTEVGEEVWSDQDQAMTQQLTFTFFNDETAGTPLRHFMAGPGMDEITTDMGFTPAP